MIYLGWAIGMAIAIGITCVVSYLVEQWEKY